MSRDRCCTRWGDLTAIFGPLASPSLPATGTQPAKCAILTYVNATLAQPEAFLPGE
jgi:hypothetical protein